MVDIQAKIYTPDGEGVTGDQLKGGSKIIDLYGREQMVRRAKTTSEKEYQLLEFENGTSMFCLTYLSILTWEDEVDAIDLKPGDKVLGYEDGRLTEVAVKDSLWVTVVNKKRLGMPKKVKMFFLETYEDMPIVVNGIVIGMRKQLGSQRINEEENKLRRF